MADYAADVKKYDPAASDAVIAAIVKHLGIALRNRDSSLVSCSDKGEMDTVRDSWCMRRLGVDAPTAEAAIKTVCTTLKADRSKERVTFYYLCAKELGKLDALG